jgi:hypothetical protein
LPRPNYESGRFSGPSQVASSGGRVPAWDGTHGGLYSSTSSVQYAGLHKYSKQNSKDSKGNRYESEHQIPSESSKIAGVQGYKQDGEPAMSMLKSLHQPQSGAQGLGGGYVSSTGTGYVPSGYRRQVASGIRPSSTHSSGASYYGAMRRTGADEMNVSSSLAPGVHSMVDGHYRLGRLSTPEANDLKTSTANRHYNEQQYGYSTGAPPSPYRPSDPDFRTQTSSGRVPHNTPYSTPSPRPRYSSPTPQPEYPKTDAYNPPPRISRPPLSSSSFFNSPAPMPRRNSFGSGGGGGGYGTPSYSSPRPPYNSPPGPYSTGGGGYSGGGGGYSGGGSPSPQVYQPTYRPPPGPGY